MPRVRAGVNRCYRPPVQTAVSVFGVTPAFSLRWPRGSVVLCALLFACDDGGDSAPDAELDVTMVDVALDAALPDAAPPDAAPDMAPDMPPDAAPDGPAPDLEPPKLPDLVFVAEKTEGDVWLDAMVVDEDSCAWIEGCVSGLGRRLLLRFPVSAANLGDVDLVMGRPEDNAELYEYSPCHDHHHFNEYAEFGLLTADGEVAVPGRKQAFCLLDSERYLTEDPTVRSTPRYTCEFQGISRGWYDTYRSGLDCQWLDVTDIEPGEYQLSVRINPEGILEEKTLDNNAGIVPAVLPSGDITRECAEGERSDLRRSCGWMQAEVGECAFGEVVRVGCSGAAGCELGVCEGDPMMRACEGEDTQCLPSESLGQDSKSCDTPCPLLTFDCPRSGRYTMWVASEQTGEDFICNLETTRDLPPPADSGCGDFGDPERGLDRECGWTVALDAEVCEPGARYRVGCAFEDPACDELGEACEGDPMMRVCPDDLRCRQSIALAESDDSCDGHCPTTNFRCPESGLFTTLVAPYRHDREATCVPGFIRED